MIKPKSQEKFLLNTKILRQARNEKGLKQKEVAKAIGIDRRYYNAIENGKFKSVSTKLLTRLSEFFNIPVIKFFRKEGRKGIDELTLQEFRQAMTLTFGIDFEGIPYQLIPTSEFVRMKALYFDPTLENYLYDFFNSYKHWSLIKPTGEEIKQFMTDHSNIIKDKSVDNIAKLFMEIREQMRFKK